MSSIIPFRITSGTDRQEADLKGLLATGTEAVNISALALERAAPAIRDWTNQEMADLARVQFLLSRAGVPLETDRGLTDEGDPWFVFCDAQGEVFVHICRMGMIYLLDGPSLEAPLRGVSFDALVRSFVDRATARVAALNVVPLAKDTKIFLHPSVMLAALIWSLFLMTDQMTNAAYASSFDPNGQDDASAGASNVEGAFGLLAEALRVNENDIDRLIASKATGKDGLLAHSLASSDKTGAGSSWLNPAVLTSLSAIALAFGLLRPAESIAATVGHLPEATSSAHDRVSFVGGSAHLDEIRFDKHHHDQQPIQVHQSDQGHSYDWSQIVNFSQLSELNTRIAITASEFFGALAAGPVCVTSPDLGMPSVIALTAPVESGAAGASPSTSKAETAKTVSATSMEAAQTKTSDGGGSSKAPSRPIDVLSFETLNTQISKSAEGLIVVHSTSDNVIASTKVVGHLHELLLNNYEANTSDTLKALLKLEDAGKETKADVLKNTPEASVNDDTAADPADHTALADRAAENQHSSSATATTSVTATTTVTTSGATNTAVRPEQSGAQVSPTKASAGDIKTDAVLAYAAPAPISSNLLSTINTTGAATALNSSAQSLNASTSNQFDAYTDAARNLVEFLLRKQKDIVVIKLANEIVIMDKTALDEATDMAYAHSWSVADGGVVSTVGHYADYKGFGLL